jgi:hypothetical protein
MSDLSPEGRGLFEAARREALPSEVDRERIRAALLARLAVTLPVAQTSSVPGALAKGKFIATLKVLGSVSGLVLAVAGTRSIIVHHEKPANSSAALASAPVAHAPTNGTLPNRESAPAQAQEPTSGTLGDNPTQPTTPSEANDKPSASHLSALPSASSARDEMGSDLALLSSARQALAAHQPAEALQELDRHASQYPASAFREERAYTRIRALCELGRTAQAQADATRFARAWPASMYRSGIDHSCAGNTER